MHEDMFYEKSIFISFDFKISNFISIFLIFVKVRARLFYFIQVHFRKKIINLAMDNIYLT